ncbi:MAG: low molecular weight phosphatase family protein [Bacteroidetes bacterium QH_1_64_81]|nr:MAG: low molecular weight phosphatase family protein [Bacteroidetes bacterium QH_1_64_81]
MAKTSVLFVCTHNSARSQMAEGLLRDRYGDQYDVYSAGTERTHVRPLATAVMEEVNVDLSDHHSKTIDDLGGRTFDVVVTVCDAAREACPYLPAEEENLHRSFEDPSSAQGTDEERRAVFRRVRDALADWIDETFAPEATETGSRSP